MEPAVTDGDVLIGSGARTEIFRFDARSTMESSVLDWATDFSRIAGVKVGQTQLLRLKAAVGDTLQICEIIEGTLVGGERRGTGSLSRPVDMRRMVSRCVSSTAGNTTFKAHREAHRYGAEPPASSECHL